MNWQTLAGVLVVALFGAGAIYLIRIVQCVRREMHNLFRTIPDYFRLYAPLGQIEALKLSAEYCECEKRRLDQALRQWEIIETASAASEKYYWKLRKDYPPFSDFHTPPERQYPTVAIRRNLALLKLIKARYHAQTPDDSVRIPWLNDYRPGPPREGAAQAITSAVCGNESEEGVKDWDLECVITSPGQDNGKTVEFHLPTVIRQGTPFYDQFIEPVLGPQEGWMRMNYRTEWALLIDKSCAITIKHVTTDGYTHVFVDSIVAVPEENSGHHGKK